MGVIRIQNVFNRVGHNGIDFSTGERRFISLAELGTLFAGDANAMREFLSLPGVVCDVSTGGVQVYRDFATNNAVQTLISSSGIYTPFLGFCGAEGGVDEDFSDYSNGQQPATRFTQYIANDPVPDVSSVQSQALRYEVLSPGVADYDRAKYINTHRATFDPATDFEFQIDYNIEQIAGVVGTDGPNIKLGFYRLQDGGGGGISNFIQVGNSHIGLVYNARTGYHSGFTYTPASMSGKLKFRYEHGTFPATVKAWYWDTGAWVLLATLQSDTITLQGARPYIEFECEGNLSNRGTMRATVDNFLVNEATISDCSVVLSPADGFELGTLDVNKWTPLVIGNVPSPTVSADVIPFTGSPNDDFETGVLDTNRWTPEVTGGVPSPTVSADQY